MQLAHLILCLTASRYVCLSQIQHVKGSSMLIILGLSLDWVPQMLVLELLVLCHLHNIDTYCHGVILVAACAPVSQQKWKLIVTDAR